MKIGLEKEFFLLSEGEPIAIGCDGVHLSHDACGWLVEARGEPFHDPVDAVFSLKSDVYKIGQQLAELNRQREGEGKSFLTLTDTPVMKVSKVVRIQAARHNAKGLIEYQNLYGYACHKNAALEGTAGVHVSFTQEDSIYEEVCKTCGHQKSRVYNVNFDWPQLFMKLDEAFAEEIKEAKRRPGFYEIKQNGRVEYRSLPANVDFDKLIEVLKSLPRCGY